MNSSLRKRKEEKRSKKSKESDLCASKTIEEESKIHVGERKGIDFRKKQASIGTSVYMFVAKKANPK
jgi:hypothetical protein